VTRTCARCWRRPVTRARSTNSRSPGAIEQVQLDIEQWARALFGKEVKIVDPKDRMVGIAQNCSR